MIVGGDEVLMLRELVARGFLQEIRTPVVYNVADVTHRKMTVQFKSVPLVIQDTERGLI